jgi:CIC family chloride channel protein
VLLISSLAGVISGLCAAVLKYALYVGSDKFVGSYTHLGDSAVGSFRWGVLVLPALGGLVAALAMRLFSITSEHGTDQLIRAFHRDAGQLPMRDPTVKAAGAVCVISCGGSAGPEGPIAALGAAIGSSLGRVFALTPRERRIMLVAGCGAGVGAIFQCPLGGALFAASILYRESDYETDAIMPAFVASVLGYSAYMPFWGYGTHLLQDADRLSFSHPMELVPFLILGPLCGLTCTLFRFSLRSTEHFVARLGRATWLAPTAGGLTTGAIACILPQVMDGQYVFVQNAMDGGFQNGLDDRSWFAWAALFAAVAVAKCVATGFTVGSGAPGGVLGPGVFIGGVLGAFLGALLMAIAPDTFTPDAENLRRALIPVGMAGVLSASMRVPLAAVVMVVEMTGGYGLIVPLMLVCVTSYLVGRRWGLNDEQVPTSLQSPAHAGDLIIHMLELNTARQLMEQDSLAVVAPDVTLHELVQRLDPGTAPVFVVVDGGRVVGLISSPEIRGVTGVDDFGGLVIAADMMTTHSSVLRTDDNLYTVVSEMSRTGYLSLPVIDAEQGGRFAGVITRSRIHRLLRTKLDDMSRHLFSEHSNLAAIEQEENVFLIASGVSAGSPDRIQRLLVPIQAIGKSLREADFRRSFGVQVIAVESKEGTIQCPPDVDAPLQTDQRLLVVESADDADSRR